MDSSSPLETAPQTPRLRALEISEWSDPEGNDWWILRDREGLAETQQVPLEFGPLLAFMDGTRDISEIEATFAKRYQQALPPDFLAGLVAQLDERLLLDSPRFAQHRRDVMATWNDAEIRPATLAGLSYPADADELREYLNDLFARARDLERENPTASTCSANGRGIVVPHIDFTRGGAVEALAYRALLKQNQTQPFDVLVILGIAHSGVRYPFCATAKDFETPLGICRTDREFVLALQERVGPRFKSEQWAHKNEHSIEFVTVFLQHLEALSNARIVPILCGGFFDEIRTGRAPEISLDILQFIETLREVTQLWENSGQRVGFIASVDGAHIGTPFGDEFVLTPKLLQEIEGEDRAFWQTIGAGDRAAMHAHIARDDNARKVDAHPALYTLMAAFPDLHGELLYYDQAFNAARNELVSFASLALCGE